MFLSYNIEQPRPRVAEPQETDKIDAQTFFVPSLNIVVNFENFNGQFVNSCLHVFLIRNLAQDLVPKVPNFSTSNSQIVVLTVAY